MNSNLAIATTATKSGIHALRERKAQRARDNYTTLLHNARDLEEAREAARLAVAGTTQHDVKKQPELQSLAEQARRRLDEAVAEANKRKEEAAQATKKATKKAKKQAKKAAKQAKQEAKKVAAQAKDLANDAAQTTGEAWNKATDVAADTAQQVKESTVNTAAAAQDALESAGKDAKKKAKKAEKQGKKQAKKAKKDGKKLSCKAKRQVKKAEKKAAKKANVQQRSTSAVVLRRAGLLALLASLAYGIYYLVTNKTATDEVATTPPTTADYEKDEVASSIRETQEKLVYSSETPIFDEVVNNSDSLDAQLGEAVTDAAEETKED
ncbi:MAG: hypothetical protein Q3976_03505 [Corynebacterium sp.]|nr:hypothetical protein [Corynebacterium sp.]